MYTCIHVGRYVGMYVCNTVYMYIFLYDLIVLSKLQGAVQQRADAEPCEVSHREGMAARLPAAHADEDGHGATGWRHRTAKRNRIT